MAKTDMTRAIEKALKLYYPTKTCGIKINTFRPSHTAFEVPVANGTTAEGIVDAVRVQEYFGDLTSRRICRPAQWRKDGFRGPIDCPKGRPMTGKLELHCDMEECRWNGAVQEGEAKILITCYEIKVTKSDFKSEHGHNFVGNLNYYVIPKELYEEVKDLVPEDIGIILYLSAGAYIGLRRKKECQFKEMPIEDQAWMMLTVMKRLEETTWKERKSLSMNLCEDCAHRESCEQKVQNGTPGGSYINGCTSYLSEDYMW